MASTYTPIASTTLSSAQSSVTFSSISGSYTDLVLIITAATTHSDTTFPYMQFNSDTGSNYSITELYGDGSAAGSARSSNSTSGWIGFDISIPMSLGYNVAKVDIMKYSNSSTYKTWLARNNQTTGSAYQGTAALVGLWRSTSAITSISIYNARGGTGYNFATGSTFSLYGIKAA